QITQGHAHINQEAVYDQNGKSRINRILVDNVAKGTFVAKAAVGIATSGASYASLGLGNIGWIGGAGFAATGAEILGASLPFVTVPAAIFRRRHAYTEMRSLDAGVDSLLAKDDVGFIPETSRKGLAGLAEMCVKGSVRD